jgi:hypothetical protein
VTGLRTAGGRYPACRAPAAKLAVVSPKLIEAYRDDEMTLEQLMAFTIVSRDHKQQEKVWKDLPGYGKQNGDDSPIRRALTAKHIPSDNDFAQFVGIEAYEAAGSVDLQPHKIAASEFAIDGKIEKSEVAHSVLQL